MKPNPTYKKPEWVQELKPGEAIILDMTKLVENGLEPMTAVLQRVEEMRPCQCLHVIFYHEPLLLCKALEEKGFEHYAECKQGTWDIYFRQKGCPCPGQS